MSPTAHIQYLAETIGPRGSTTQGEARAAQYALGVLRRAGLSAEVQSFKSARSGWWPFSLYSGLLLVGFALFQTAGSAGALSALALGIAAFTSVLLELTFRPNPLRWVLPTGGSQNVWARIAPSGRPLRQVVLLGHLDTHRTPLAFSDDGWLRLFRVLIPFGLVSSVLLLALFAVGSADPAPLWRQLAALPGLVLLGVFVMTFQADYTPFTPGANDNASGAAVVLSLAERLARAPLRHTSVTAVLTGCEEVGCYGAEAFARAHRQELLGAAWLTVDSVGGQGTDPCYLLREAFLLTTRSDRGLVQLAERVAAAHPELRVGPYAFGGAYTEGAIGAKYGQRVLSFLSVRPDGKIPEWHRPTDVAARLDPEVVRRTEAFLWELLQAMDA